MRCATEEPGGADWVRGCSVIALERQPARWASRLCAAAAALILPACSPAAPEPDRDDVPARAETSALTGLTGMWTVDAVSPHSALKVELGKDTPAYAGRQASFSTDGLRWRGDAPGGLSQEYEFCLRPSFSFAGDAATLIVREFGELPLGRSPKELRRPAYRVSCREGVGGFPDALVVPISRDELLITWYQDAVLVLRRRPERGQQSGCLGAAKAPTTIPAPPPTRLF